MEDFCDISDLPLNFPKKVISEIATQEEFVNFKVSITQLLENGDNYMGDMFRVKIVGNNKSASTKCLRLIFKMAFSSKDLRECFPIHEIYKKEIKIYTELLPYFDRLQDEFKIPLEERFKIVKCYKTVTEEYGELIVMEDLVADGFQMCSRFKTVDWDHLILVTKNMARIHAFSFAIQARDPQLLANMESNSDHTLTFVQNCKRVFRGSVEEALKYIDDEISKEKIEKFSADNSILKYMGPDVGHPYNVICHGDSWINNFMFKYEGTTPVDIRTLDWQMFRYTSPVYDLAYMIFLSTDEDTRSKKFTAILDLYYETLSSRLSQMNLDVSVCYPKDVFKRHLHDILPVGLLYTFFSLPLQMSEVGRAPDVLEIINNTEFFKTKKYSQICIDRIQGVVRDFVTHGLI